MSSISIKRRLAIRFVLIAEVLGYALSLLIIGGAIAMAFIDVEVTVVASGELRPAATPLRLSREAVVFEDLHMSGTEVQVGEAVANIVEDPQQFDRAMTARTLRPLVTQLRTDQIDSALSLLNAVETYQREIGSTVKTNQVAAPVSGIWITTTPLALSVPIPRGGLLGAVHQLSRFTLLARIDGKNAAGISTGQKVETRLPDGARMTGMVISKGPVTNGAAQIEAQFDDPPPSLRAEWARRLADPSAPVTPSQSITITTGRQSLFAKLVLRK